MPITHKGERDRKRRSHVPLARGVVMIEGASRMGDGKFEKTIYTGCFSARTGNYYYAMYGDPSIRYVS